MKVLLTIAAGLLFFGLVFQSVLGFKGSSAARISALEKRLVAAESRHEEDVRRILDMEKVNADSINKLARASILNSDSIRILAGKR